MKLWSKHESARRGLFRGDGGPHGPGAPGPWGCYVAASVGSLATEGKRPPRDLSSALILGYSAATGAGSGPVWDDTRTALSACLVAQCVIKTLRCFLRCFL